MSDDLLTVWYGSRRVGELQRGPTGTMDFQYEPGWVRGDGFAISQSMPLDRGELSASAEQAHNFFANLLPEGGARDLIVRRYRLTNDDFELLRALGSECAGALLILPAGQEPDSLSSQDYERFDDARLADLLFDHGWNFEPSENVRLPRLSLAGAQNKTTVALFDGMIWLPKGTTPSTHILKFDSLEYRHVLAYECFATMLAGSVGLPVVEFELRTLGRDLFALVKRYDRVRGDDGQTLRLHQEDFCQALGYSSRKKYESDGGPSFARCYRLVRDVCDAPLDDLERLFRWQIFNLLAGNSDGHAKNLSLLYGRDGSACLAPFYDLVPTRAIANLDPRLAFNVGGVREPGNVGRRQWESLAVECDVRPRAVLSLVEEIAEHLIGHANEIRERFEDIHGSSPALDRVVRVLNRQCRRAARGN